MALLAFATVDDVRSTDRTAQDLDAASQVIRNYCGWHIFPELTESLVLDGPGTPLLVLPTRRLLAVTALTETALGTGSSAVVVNVADLEISTRKGLVWHASRRCWTARASGIAITIRHGYPLPPPDVAQLAVSLASRLSANPQRLRRIQVGQRSEDYATDMLLTAELAQLDAYRRIA